MDRASVTAVPPRPAAPETCRCGHAADRHQPYVHEHQDACAGGTPGFCGCPCYIPASTPDLMAALKESFRPAAPDTSGDRIAVGHDQSGRPYAVKVTAPDAAAGDGLRSAIEEWAAPDSDLGWPGSAEVALHAQEIADFLWELGIRQCPCRACHYGHPLECER